MKTPPPKDTQDRKDGNPPIDKTDALIHIMGMPDFIGIKTYLNRALTFATTDDHRKAVHIRLDRIDRVILYYKAE